MSVGVHHEDGREDHEELGADDAGDADEDEPGDSEGDYRDAGSGNPYLVMMFVHLITFNIFSELYDMLINIQRPQAKQEN